MKQKNKWRATTDAEKSNNLAVQEEFFLCICTTLFSFHFLLIFIPTHIKIMMTSIITIIFSTPLRILSLYLDSLSSKYMPQMKYRNKC